MVETGGVEVDRLRGFVERIEQLEEERAVLNSDIRSIMSEARSAGFDTKTIRRVVRLRRLDPSDRIHEEQLLEVYTRALDL
ncbi:MAG: hypothetical protein CL568_04575 [Alphaproteobacteria bacterium]|jgi:uncharacterized protein (UPF0335 family)|nr:hypothetical protein [Alphaproteobacteria bacterium]PPR14325.1 MAG: hypothetical protein CFH42_00078 [Alphaproteobacteria bacterium MarineAlpha12_Bin1]|tara:strand:+ start:10596 stop:10838 length:243 start_codon:yes stop_codon:yes gene_type:complete